MISYYDAISQPMVSKTPSEHFHNQTIRQDHALRVLPNHHPMLRPLENHLLLARNSSLRISTTAHITSFYITAVSTPVSQCPTRENQTTVQSTGEHKFVFCEAKIIKKTWV